MFNNKYVYITILVILAILLIILGVYLFIPNNTNIINTINTNSLYKTDECSDCAIEQFSSTVKENYENLISNGNFENGQDITNPINKSGINKIISKSNPGKSSYVLSQQKSDELTFYQITCDSVQNSKYIFFFLDVCIK